MSSSTLFKQLLLRNNWANQIKFHMELLWDRGTKVYSNGSGPLAKKKLAFLQLLCSSEAAEKLRKSRRYWHLRKSRLLHRAAEKPAFSKLLLNSAEKLQKSRLFYSFDEAFTQSFVKIVMMIKSCVNAPVTQVPILPALVELLHAAFMQTCVKAAFLQLLRRPA